MRPTTGMASAALRRLAPSLVLALASVCGAPQAAPTPPSAADIVAAPTDARPPDASRAARPRVALVLSGGGARGFAHVGVLRVLHEARIPVDLVWGTSMGAVVGGAYAAGRTPDELADFARRTDWDAVLADRPPREQMALRRREEDLALRSRVEFALGPDGLSLPPGAVGHSVLELALAQLLPEGLHQRASRELPIPFGSVASDLLTGELVDQAGTPTLQALRASLSVPGVFAPVRVNGRLLVDGGLVRNLPVDLARRAGADVVIAVNVGTPLGGEAELGSSLGVARQMLAILTEQNVARSLAELGGADILITPQLAGIGFLDFSAHAAAMAAGEAAARAALGRLAPLSLPADDYAAHLAARTESRRQAAPQDRLALGTLRIEGQQRLATEALVARAGLEAGAPVTTLQAYEAAARLQAHGDISRVDVDVRDRDGRRDVRLRVTEAEWARSRLRLGLELATDFGDSSSFALAAMHAAAPLNRWGTELRTTARIGTRRQLDIEAWQPLGRVSPWFAAAQLEHLSGPQDLYVDERHLGRFYRRATGLQLAVGRAIDDWGDLRFGVGRSRVDTRMIWPAEGQRARSFENQALLRLRGDTLDSLGYPTRGMLVDVLWGLPLDERAAGQPRDSRLDALGLWAFSSGSWSGHLYLEGARARQSVAPRALGGFWRLSGTQTDSLRGQTTLLGRWVWARELIALSPALGRSLRAGFSLELGGGFAPDQSVDLGDMKTAGSLFVSADTRLGPLYLGIGGTRGGHARLYVFLGPLR